METEKKESIFSKILVGVAIATIPVIILYILGIDKKNESTAATKMQDTNQVPVPPQLVTIDYSKYVNLYTGTSYNTSNHKTGDTYLDIKEIDNSTNKVRIEALWNNGLYGEGRLFGKVKDGKIEVQGVLYSDVTGSWDIDMEIILSADAKEIEGSYKVYPVIGNSNGTQFGQFKLTRQIVSVR